jgi:hypothetical protein
MITAFEVGAVFKIINEASPTLTRILKQIRELNAMIEKARGNLALLGKGLTPGLPAAIGETEALATAWGNVAKNASAARLALGQASARARLPSPALVNGGVGGGRGGGGRHAPGFMPSGPNAHLYTGLPIPGGSHLRLGGGAIAGAGLLGYGVYQAAEMEDAVFQLIYHSGLQQNDSNRGRFRKILQDAMGESGYSLHDIAESAKQEIRMFQGTPGGGLDVLPEMLRAATIEARLKGSSPEESMKALIGLAHMTKQYDPEAIKKLAPAFAFLSTANPSSLSSIERAAGYAVPILQSSLEIDPMQSLLLGTALTRAGATSTKSGTWLREMALRAMPGTAIFESEKKAEHHDELLRRLGLLDQNDKPLWFTGGRPDIFKLLEIAGSNLDKMIPLSERAGVERKLFGAQGSGGLALLTDPAVREQIKALSAEMNSPEFKNRYGGFVEAYQQGSTVQQARTAMADFNITMMEIGKTVLPSVNSALHDFKGLLESIRDILPGAKTGQVGARVMEGTLAGVAGGAAIGAFGGPVGMAGGAIIGGVAGGVYGVAEQYYREQAAKLDSKDASVQKAGDVTRALAAGAMPPISLSLNIDGRTLAQAMSDVLQSYYTFATGAAAADGVNQYYSGDHNFPSK